MSIITNPNLEYLWGMARDNPVWATTGLWEHIFKKDVFADEKFMVSSQRPPTKEANDQRRVDFVVERMGRDGRTIKTLLFVQAEEADAQPSAIINVESQAFEAAHAYSANNNHCHVWTMTIVGTKARLWRYRYNRGRLDPFIPQGEGSGELDEYLEIFADGQKIINGLEVIKRNPTPPERRRDMEALVRDAYRALGAQEATRRLDHAINYDGYDL